MVVIKTNSFWANALARSFAKSTGLFTCIFACQNQRQAKDTVAIPFATPTTESCQIKKTKNFLLLILSCCKN